MADNTAVYEGLFILDSNRFARDRDALAREIEALVEAIDGEILVSRLWEERRLAYPIKGQRKGAYWLTYFRLDSKHLTTLNRETTLNDNILRALFIKVEPRLVEALVSHAQSGGTAPRRPVEAPVVAEDVEAVGVGAGDER